MAHDSNRQHEALDAQVRLDGQGEDPAVKALLSDEFATMSNVDALSIARQLQEIIRGQAVMGEQFSRLNQRMNAMDEAQLKWEQDKTKFLEKISNMADRMMLPEAKQAELRAKESNRLQGLVKEKKANAHVERLSMIDKLSREPKETVVAPGDIVMVRKGGQTVPVLAPLTINLYGIKYVLPPGKPVEVPASVASRFRNIMAMREETEARKELLDAAPGKIKQDTVLASDWDSVSEKYGSNADPIPLGSTA